MRDKHQAPDTADCSSVAASPPGEDRLIVSIPVRVAVALESEPKELQQCSNLTKAGNSTREENDPPAPLEEAQRDLYSSPLQCSECGSKFKWERNLVRHCRKKHGTLGGCAFPCRRCNLCLPSHSAYETHLVNHLRGSSHFRCGVCGRQYETAKRLWLHKRRCHRRPRQAAHHHRSYVQSVDVLCAHVLKSSFVLNRPRRVRRRRARRLHGCANCPGRFFTPLGLSRHVCRNSGKDVDSPLCRPSQPPGAPPRELLQPLIVPLGQASCPQGFKCVLCGKVLTTVYNFHRHMNLHTGHRAYPCSQCEQVFKTYDIRRRHLTREHRGSCLPATPTATSTIRRCRSQQLAKKQVTLSNHSLCQEKGIVSGASEDEEAEPLRKEEVEEGVSRDRVERTSAGSFVRWVCEVEQNTSYASPRTSTPVGAEEESVAISVPQRNQAEEEREKFHCQECDKSYSQIRSLRTHVRFRHPPPRPPTHMKLRGVEQEWQGSDNERPPPPSPVEDPPPSPVEDPLPSPVEDPLPSPVEDLPPSPVEDLPPSPVEDPPPSPVEDLLPQPAESGRAAETISLKVGSPPVPQEEQQRLPRAGKVRETVIQVLPVCGEILVEGGGDTSQPYAILKKHGPWNVVYF